MNQQNFNFTPRLLTFLAALVLFINYSQPASAQSCEVNCLRVYSISLTNLGDRIRGIVKLTDETYSGAGTRSAVVHVLWTEPDGTTTDRYDVIGTRLRAEYSFYTGGTPGTYTLTVAGATKPDYMFDPQNSSILSKSITVAGDEDADQDGVADQQDNCLLVSNANQNDADNDGFGNTCDADFNNDCIVNNLDFSEFVSSFLSANSVTDLNSDGIVNFLDLSFLQSLFLSPPGPTSLPNDCE